LAIQYADFANWQREWLQGDVLEAQLDYWKRALHGVATLKLPTDRPRPALQTFRGAREPVSIPKELASALRALSREENATLFMTLLAAFQVLLQRVSGQNDIVVGTDVANRNRGEVENLIGFFINQLVLRSDLSGNPAFRELLASVRSMTLGAYEHQDVPFEKLVEVLKPERSMSHAPLFQVKIILQNAPQSSLQLPDLTIRPTGVDAGTSQLDLTLYLRESELGLDGSLQYNTDLFEASTVARLVRNFVTLLGNIVAEPDARIGKLDILSEEEKRQQAEAEQRREASALSKFKSIKPRRVDKVAQEELVATRLLREESSLPLVVQPNVADMDVVEWAANNRESIDAMLLKHGAVLFRGFNLATAEMFERFASTVGRELFSENGEHPREVISGKVYTPVFYPPEKRLLWHNENSFNHRWPAKIWFGCAQPALTGGETPIVDSRKVFERMPVEIRERFMEKGVMYVRNYGTGLGLDWQTVFQTTSKADVEAHCRESHMEFEWKEDDGLRTRCVRPAVIKHPLTGEQSWFNQAQHWHPACLDKAARASMSKLFAVDDLPRNCFYGDGSPIEDAVMETICAVYEELEHGFAWQAGDLLMLDNVLTAHGRNPFTGERKLLVAVGDMTSYTEI
jgi:alpha-ketoglutarate-dependent taurine dioxygenase